MSESPCFILGAINARLTRRGLPRHFAILRNIFLANTSTIPYAHKVYLPPNQYGGRNSKGVSQSKE